jgi:hypothetical protein
MSHGLMVFYGVIIVDGDMTWFDGERETYTWNALGNLVVGHMDFGGRTIFTKGLKVSLGGLTSPFRA